MGFVILILSFITNNIATIKISCTAIMLTSINFTSFLRYIEQIHLEATRNSTVRLQLQTIT